MKKNTLKYNKAQDETYYAFHEKQTQYSLGIMFYFSSVFQNTLCIAQNLNGKFFTKWRKNMLI